MGKTKNRYRVTKQDKAADSTKILGWEISATNKKKLIQWTIEGLIISVITFAILWLPLFLK